MSSGAIGSKADQHYPPSTGRVCNGCKKVLSNRTKTGQLNNALWMKHTC